MKEKKKKKKEKKQKSREDKRDKKARRKRDRSHGEGERGPVQLSKVCSNSFPGFAPASLAMAAGRVRPQHTPRPHVCAFAATPWRLRKVQRYLGRGGKAGCSVNGREQRVSACMLASTSCGNVGMHLQIRLKVEKTEEDVEAERRRADLLASLNSFYE